jgi:hypothetical protein
MVIDAMTGGIFGVYPSRLEAQSRADQLQTQTWSRYQR